MIDVENCAACGEPADPRFFWRNKPMCDGCCPGPDDDEFFRGFADGKIAARSIVLAELEASRAAVRVLREALEACVRVLEAPVSGFQRVDNALSIVRKTLAATSESGGASSLDAESRRSDGSVSR